jgi:alpha-methylacyl-CoA racemase
MGQTRQGPLTDVRVLEMASLAPGPFAACLLADMGADVVKVDRPEGRSPFGSVLLDRGKRSIAVDLKNPAGVELVLGLVEAADILIEGFRPGVMERLGLGPDVCLARRPQLVYGRMTGYGQDGPMANRAGHDINYIALGGVLARIGRAGEPPTPPLNLVGDFGGGGMVLAFGLLAALHEARRSGTGQVVDTAMVEGSALLMLPFFGGRNSLGLRGTTILDSGAPFYDAYETADGGWVAVGAIEPQFYAALVSGLGLKADELPPQMDQATWPEVKAKFAAIFRTQTRAEWVETFEGTDACVTPVLELDEVELDPHNAARETFVEVGGVLQPAPAPRLGVTPGVVARPPCDPGGDGAEVLAEWTPAWSERLEQLGRDGVVRL